MRRLGTAFALAVTLALAAAVPASASQAVTTDTRSSSAPQASDEARAGPCSHSRPRPGTGWRAVKPYGGGWVDGCNACAAAATLWQQGGYRGWCFYVPGGDFVQLYIKCVCCLRGEESAVVPARL
jgi:hypothetical protein